jgi:NAD(P)-dependent dehydrogenase (short-subunit alcohol dehydrogenase family)
MARPISDSVIVITGASSGIGRATAVACARQGASVVLAARREAALRAVAGECERVGGHALVVATDVTDEQQVQRLAERAVEHFGRLDVWINNAAVLLFARFHEAPPALYRRVIETDLFGYIHGARAALRRFREQGSGVLINMASIVAYCPQPYTSAYVCSNHAIRGLSDSLRMELRLEGADHIHVCTVLPASIDTPFFRHAANYTGRAAKASNPVYAADAVARTVLSLIARPRREAVVGNAGRTQIWQRLLAPRHYERSAAQQIHTDHFQDRRAGSTEGNLFGDSQWTSVSGGWQAHEAKQRGGLATAGLAATALALAASALLLWTKR